MATVRWVRNVFKCQPKIPRSFAVLSRYLSEYKLYPKQLQLRCTTKPTAAAHMWHVCCVP